MIILYKDSCYCLTDWLTDPTGTMVQRRIISPTGNVLNSEYIAFRTMDNREFTLVAQGILKEPFDLYLLYNKEALKPVRRYDNSLLNAKHQVDDFLKRVDKLRAFI